MTAAMPKLKAPFPYFGGKSRAASIIWDRLGDVPNYVEPFCGSMAVLLNRPHAPNLETVNDIDCFIANWWRSVIADPYGVAAAADYPVNELDLHSRHLWLVNQGAKRIEKMKKEPKFYDVQVAGWWVWGISQWIGSGWCSKPEWVGRANLSGKRGIHTVKGGHTWAGYRGTKYQGRPSMRREGINQVGPYPKRPAISNSGRGVHRRGSRIPIEMPNEKRPSLASRSMSGVHAKKPNIGGRQMHGILQTTQRDKLVEWFSDLQERLRRTRVCCGDWKRVLTPAVTYKIGGSMLTGVFLDPPYNGDTGRDPQLYNEESLTISKKVREWAIENGTNRMMRICLAGYEGEHDMPADWECVRWHAARGYAKAGQGQLKGKNAGRERLWFSPYCLSGTQGNLWSADLHGEDVR